MPASRSNRHRSWRRQCRGERSAQAAFTQGNLWIIAPLPEHRPGVGSSTPSISASIFLIPLAGDVVRKNVPDDAARAFDPKFSLSRGTTLSQIQPFRLYSLKMSAFILAAVSGIDNLNLKPRLPRTRAVLEHDFAASAVGPARGNTMSMFPFLMPGLPFCYPAGINETTRPPAPRQTRLAASTVSFLPQARSPPFSPSGGRRAGISRFS